MRAKQTVDVPTSGLTGNDVTDEELAAHGLDFIDALAVYNGPAKFFPQSARQRRDALGSVHRQPARLRMIGPNASGRLLTIMLELPTSERVSHVVTGYPANAGQRTRYDQPGGRTRRR